MKHHHLFQPIDIGTTRLKNRIAMAPVNNASQMDPYTGQATMTTVDYFAERARGGVGLIVSGTFKVEFDIENYSVNGPDVKKWSHFSPRSSLMLSEIVARAHAYDTKFFYQLTAGPGRVASADSIRSGNQPVSASENEAFWAPDVTCRALETSEVEEIVSAFGRAAAFAKSIDADGIEVHGHEGYLIDQFTTALWNRRTDKYGGDLRARMTFPVEILRAIKDAAGEDFTVTYRLGVRHFIEAPLTGTLDADAPEIGRGIDESIMVAKLLEEAGYDGFSLDLGAYESTYWAHPPYYFPHGFSLDMISRVTAAVGVPVMVAGRLGDPDLADRAVAEGKTDIVALGRDLLADPEWPNKVASGSLERIRPCIGCHEGCIERPTTRGLVLSCSVNPAVSREGIAQIIPVRTKGKRILIAGGGVAGMEAARVAFDRGHDVTIFEKSDQLGGHMLEYGAPSFKGDIRSLLAWYRREVSDRAIPVEFGSTVDLGLVSNFAADVVIAATGSAYHLPELHDASPERVLTCSEVISGARSVEGRVLIVGGGSQGAETALALAQQGIDVSIIDQADDIVNSGISQINREQLVQLLADLRVPLLLRRRVNRILNSSVEVITSEREVELIPYDTVVMGYGIRSNKELYDSAYGAVDEVYQIGDCKKPRYIHDAIFEGWYLGMNI